ncbi:MAG: MBL fold metallo-hydrolase [Deltaproteobacteria bacterium]|nr:MBL fold metallo-hydrolase [Deltaproteobacteria bacterium]NIS77286.1 MBL fold metallo-hydrolase [Deltaproteobacteria bacterium]
MESSKSGNESWKSLSTFFKKTDPFFDKTLFLEGYDISSNVYAITGDYVTIIDPGNDYTVFLDLFSSGFKPSDIRKVVLTHAHYEHVMGLFELMRYPGLAENGGIEVICHESCPAGLREALGSLGPFHSATGVGGGETLNLSGFKLDVIHAPGHTMDSICLYHPASRTLFTGDAVLPYAVASPDPAAGGRIEYQLFSLRSISGMEIDNLLPGHGAPVESEAKKVLLGTYTGIIRKMIGLETAWLEGAAKLAQKGYLVEAMFCCDKELEANENNLMALELKASCLNDLGRFHEATGAFERLLEYRPGSTFALIGKGYAFMGLGRYEESLACFDRALKKDPDSREALMYRGMALYLSGRIDEAMEVANFQEEFVARFKDWVRERDRSPG